MLHQSGFEVNGQSTDALDFARRNTRVKAAKAVRKLSPWESLAEQSGAFETATFRISSGHPRLFRISKRGFYTRGACGSLKRALC
jgi:hypothetical protein